MILLLRGAVKQHDLSCSLMQIVCQFFFLSVLINQMYSTGAFFNGLKIDSQWIIYIINQLVNYNTLQ